MRAYIMLHERLSVAARTHIAGVLTVDCRHARRLSDRVERSRHVVSRRHTERRPWRCCCCVAALSLRSIAAAAAAAAAADVAVVDDAAVADAP